MYNSQPYYIKSIFKNQLVKRSSTMIYYIFPKLQKTFLQNSYCSYDLKQPIPIYIPSLYHYVNEILSNYQLYSKCLEIHNKFLQVLNEINYNTDLCIYESIEIFQIFHISFPNYPINTLHFDELSYENRNYLCKNIHTSNLVAFENDHVFSPKYDFAYCSSYELSEYNNAINAFCQMCITVLNLKKNGNCLLKYNDIFLHLSLEMILFFSTFFDKTFIYKPAVANIAKGDRYIIFRGFQGTNETTQTYVKNIFQGIRSCSRFQSIQNILQTDIPILYWSKLEEINSIFGQAQLESIQDIANNIDSEISVKQKAEAWCNKYMKKV